MNTPFDSPEWRETRDGKLLTWMCGDATAVRFLLNLFQIAEVWDDLIDRDKPIDDSDINDAFTRALLVLPTDPFYAQNQSFLHPLMVAGINSWLDANTLERYKDANWRGWAFFLRDWYMELVNACMFIIGGWEHMRAHSLEARMFFQAEAMADYLEDAAND